MTIAYWCVLFMGLFPIVAAGIAKKGFEDYDNASPRQWLAKQTGFRARANTAQANLFESLPLFSNSNNTTPNSIKATSTLPQSIVVY